MSQVAIETFTLTLTSNDRTVEPPAPTFSRHMAFRTDIQPLLQIKENQVWQMSLSNIEFLYTGAAAQGVFVNVSLVSGTRIGSTRAQFLYRIPGPALDAGNHTSHPHVFYVPDERPSLATVAEADSGTRRVVEVAITDEPGKVLPAPANNDVATTLTISFQRVQ
jgi:hypothetical protein